MSTTEWYSAKTICKHHLVEEGVPKSVFEERVVLLRAASFDDAINQAETEVAKYCAESSVQTDYLGYVDVYRLFFEESVGHGTEVFSLMRDSTLSNSEYLDRFCDDGHERRRKSPPEA